MNKHNDIHEKVKAFISSTYGTDTPHWGVYRNKKTGETIASKKKPCPCAWDILHSGLTESQALDMVK